MIRLTAIITLLLLLLSPCYLSSAEDILDYLSSKERFTLYSEGEISRYFFDKEKPEYLFSTTYGNELLSELSNLDITIGVESLYFLEYSDNLSS